MEESNCRFVRKIRMAKVNDTLKIMQMEKSILNSKICCYIFNLPHYKIFSYILIFVFI